MRPRYGKTRRLLTTIVMGVVTVALVLCSSGTANAAVYFAYTPGTNYKANIPAAIAGAGHVSNGDLVELVMRPDVQTFFNVNPEVYPGELGLGNMPGAVSGMKSVKGGAEGIVSYVVTATRGDTSANVVLFGGSQGALVNAVAAAELVRLGYTNITGISMSSPRGFLERFSEGTPVLWFGLDPGAPPMPETGQYLEVGNQFDPMVGTSRFLLDPFLLINFVLGFVFYHGNIMEIDYSDPANVVEVDGNVTRVTLHNEWVPLLAPVVLLLRSQGLRTEWLTPIDDVLRGMMRLGLESEGTFQVMPSPGQMVQGLRYTMEGIAEAIKHTVQLILHQPLSKPSVPGVSPVKEAIDKALENASVAPAGQAAPEPSAPEPEPETVPEPTEPPVAETRQETIGTTERSEVAVQNRSSKEDELVTLDVTQPQEASVTFDAEPADDSSLGIGRGDKSEEDDRLTPIARPSRQAESESADKADKDSGTSSESKDSSDGGEGSEQ